MFQQTANPAEVPEWLQALLGLSAGAALTACAMALIVVLMLRLITMWWFGVTTVINRLDRVISMLSTIEKRGPRGE